MIPFVATGLTWLRVFKGPCLILALAGVLVGGGWFRGKRSASTHVMREVAA